MRLVIFNIFWKSVQTKITGLTVADQHLAFWNLTDSAYFQFYEFESSLLANDWTPILATYGEFFLSLMILFGIFTRFAALGLLIMIMTIQFLAVPEAWWTLHIYWTLIVIYLMKHGGGKVSLDNLLLKR
ncbi:MAG: putative oxidoreductase [Cellvibrionaceae bacterium]|jgi:putative oxidoreductase